MYKYKKLVIFAKKIYISVKALVVIHIYYYVSLRFCSYFVYFLYKNAIILYIQIHTAILITAKHTADCVSHADIFPTLFLLTVFRTQTAILYIIM